MVRTLEASDQWVWSTSRCAFVFSHEVALLTEDDEQYQTLPKDQAALAQQIHHGPVRLECLPEHATLQFLWSGWLGKLKLI